MPGEVPHPASAKAVHTVVSIDEGLNAALLPAKDAVELASVTSTSPSSSPVSTSDHPLPYLEPSSLPPELTLDLVRRCASTFKPLKPLNLSLWRWSLLWLALCLGVVLMPLYVPVLADVRAGLLVACVGLVLNVCVWLVCLSLCGWTLYRVSVGQRTDFAAVYPASFPLFHLLVLTIYKDDMAVVERTLESVAAQTEAKRVVVNIAWESRTPDVEQRTARIRERFEGKVALIHFTVHPAGLPHEIASKAANANYGLRSTVLRVLQEGGETDVSHFMVGKHKDTHTHPDGRTSTQTHTVYSGGHTACMGSATY
jgi:hypothetical protein